MVGLQSSILSETDSNELKETIFRLRKRYALQIGISVCGFAACTSISVALWGGSETSKEFSSYTTGLGLCFLLFGFARTWLAFQLRKSVRTDIVHKVTAEVSAEKVGAGDPLLLLQPINCSVRCGRTSLKQDPARLARSPYLYLLGNGQYSVLVAPGSRPSAVTLYSFVLS
jgi:hypothetical protein